MKLKEIRLKKDITASELAKAVGTDKYMISKFENGVCLPTPQMMKRICNFLGCEILQIYKKTEIYITPRNLAIEQRNEFNRANYYNFCCRLPKDCCNVLQQDKLSQFGYASKKDWLTKQINQFEIKYERFENLKNKRR